MKVERKVFIEFNLENQDDVNKFTLFNNLDNIIKSSNQFREYLQTVDEKTGKKEEGEPYHIGGAVEEKYVEIFKSNGVTV